VWSEFLLLVFFQLKKCGAADRMLSSEKVSSEKNKGRRKNKKPKKKEDKDSCCDLPCYGGSGGGGVDADCDVPCDCSFLCGLCGWHGFNMFDLFDGAGHYSSLTIIGFTRGCPLTLKNTDGLPLPCSFQSNSFLIIRSVMPTGNFAECFG